VDLDEDATLRVGGRPVAHLSEGEQLICDFGYRLALAKRTGLNFLALDATSRLGNTRTLELLLEVAAKEGVQIIATVTADNPMEIPGAKTFWIEAETAVAA
jgi:predicted ATPase